MAAASRTNPLRTPAGLLWTALLAERHPDSGETRAQDGFVERHGTLPLLWRGGHEGRFAERTRDCIL